MHSSLFKSSRAALVSVLVVAACADGRGDEWQGVMSSSDTTTADAANAPTASSSKVPDADASASPTIPIATGSASQSNPSTSSQTQTAFAALTRSGAVAVEMGSHQFEISLALLPRTFSKGGLYEYEGANYPATTAAREALVDQVAWTYAALAQECATRHPQIALPPADQPVSEAVLAKAVQDVAECAYVDFGIKPYWIPRLIADVDICARKLGIDWRTPTVRDVQSMSLAERTAVAATVGEGLYNGMEIFALAGDGKLQIANLQTGLTRALADTIATYFGETAHYEGGASLRCFRGALAPR